MRIPGKRTLARSLRPFANTLRPGGLVLGYHRVADTAWDPLGLCVHPRNFRRQLEVLSARYTPVALPTLVARLRRGERVEDLVVLTFDDGYRDFIDHALPELRRLGTPATVFVTTGFSGRRFWWNDVADALDPARRRLSRLSLRWGAAGEERVYEGLASRGGAAAAVRELCRELSFLGMRERGALVEQITDQTGAAGAAAPEALALSEAEIGELAGMDHIEVASHAVSHALLGRLSAAEQRAEIAESKRRLETICRPKTVQGFSYPHGSVSAESRQLLVDAGFAYACTSREAVVRKATDVYGLPRVWPRDVGERRFRRWLFAWRGWR